MAPRKTRMGQHRADQRRGECCGENPDSRIETLHKKIEAVLRGAMTAGDPGALLHPRDGALEIDNHVLDQMRDVGDFPHRFDWNTRFLAKE